MQEGANTYTKSLKNNGNIIKYKVVLRSNPIHSLHAANGARPLESK